MYAMFLSFKHDFICISHTCLVINSSITSQKAHMVGIRNLNVVPAPSPTLRYVRKLANLYITVFLI